MFARCLPALLACLWTFLVCAQTPRPAFRPAVTNAPATTLPAARPPQALWPGRQSDGSVLLPNQWSLRPVGRQVELDDFPETIAVHPGGKFAAVLHAGYGKHEIIVVSLPDGRITARTNLNETFYGLEFTKDGRQLFASGAGDEVIHAFGFSRGKISAHRVLRLRPAKERGVPAGLAVAARGQRLFVANVWGHRVSRVALGPPLQVTDVPLGPAGTATEVMVPRPVTGADLAALTKLAEKLPPTVRAPDLPLGPADTAPEVAPATPPTDADLAAVTKRAEAALFDVNPADSFPYACRLDEKRGRLYVSLWAQAQVAVVDVNSDRVIARWATQEHPCEMALTRSGQFLFVANSSRNTVSVLDTATGRSVETIWAALYPQSPPGSTPNSLALSPDEKLLFVANADNNVVAVFNVSAPGRSRSLGFIPVGWYPTSVRVTPDGKFLLVANGKGLSSKANPHGPQPGVKPKPGTTVEYIGGLFRGTLSIIALPAKAQRPAQFAAWTARAYQCSPLRAGAVVSASRPDGNPVPLRPGGRSPIRHCLYIIKENRTYDQMLGDLPEGNGDPALCLFPERVTPNHHALARQFVLLDNFYVEAEVSADGHEWSMAAYATDFVEKMWPLSYGHGKSGKFPYPSEGNFFVAFPAGGYLWDRAAEAGVSYRSYGEFVQNGRTPAEPAHTRVKALQGHFDPGFHGFDVGYPDQKRADRFISELHRFEAAGEMPRLQILRLPNDHTAGASAGAHTPTALVADNDLALGRVVEAVSRSRFWADTAIFVVEDDAQNGPDHVDAHRTVAFVISPWTRRGAVDSTLYSTTSLLRTMELILGLNPMSQFDAAAAPMFNAFQAQPDLRAYEARPANVDLDQRNARLAWGANLKMNFAKEDAVDDLLLNEVIWRSVRGADHPMPAPVRAGFVFARQDRDADGD